MTLSRQGPATLRSSRLGSDLGVTRSDMDARDAASIADCAAGDQTALDNLYHRHGGACLAFARQILVDAHYAEDRSRKCSYTCGATPAPSTGAAPQRGRDS